MSVEYESGLEGKKGRTDISGSCILEGNERITTVTVYTTYAGRIVQGVELLTTLKTCGPFGTPSAHIYVVSGHQLLYVSGRKGSLMDGMSFHFDYACQHTTE